MVHWAQNTIQQRFQEYAPDYNAGQVETEIIDLSSIKHVPVTMWSGLLDETCYHSQALVTEKEIGERVTYFKTVPWASHTHWGGWVSTGVYWKLRDHLIHPERKSYQLPSDLELEFLQ